MSDEASIMSILGTLYCHDCDPNSLKLLLFVLEAGLLPRISEVVHVTKHNAASMQSDLLQKHIRQDDSKGDQEGDIVSEAHLDYGIFPVCVCTSDTALLCGADRIINMLMDDVLQHRNIDWSQMVVFNFFSCGMKMEMDMLKVENKQQSKTLFDYEQLQADYRALQLQVKPNIFSIFNDEISSAGGHTFKKLQLEHQVTLSLLHDAQEESKTLSMTNENFEEELYSLKKDNIELLKEKNELRVLQEEELDHIQQESERMTIHLTEQSNAQVKKLNGIISELKRLVVKEIALHTTGGPSADSVFRMDREGPSEPVPPTMTEETADEDSDQEIQELKYLLKTSSYVQDLRAAMADREDEITALKERNSILESKLAEIESSLRE